MTVSRVVSGTFQPVVRTVGGRGYGPEKIINGKFATDTGWAKGIGWVISGAVAVRAADASSAGLSQATTFIGGAEYQVTFTLSGFTAGMFAVQFTGGTTRSGTSRTANGTYTETLLANAGNNSFRIFAGSLAAGSVGNISVREVV